jgi:hypothetical protein
MNGLGNRTPAKNCDMGCAGEPGLDLALNKLYGVPLAQDSVAKCWKNQDVACGGLPRSGFTFLLIHSNLFKGMALAAPAGSVVRPDVSDKNVGRFVDSCLLLLLLLLFSPIDSVGT